MLVGETFAFGSTADDLLDKIGLKKDDLSKVVAAAQQAKDVYDSLKKKPTVAPTTSYQNTTSQGINVWWIVGGIAGATLIAGLLLWKR